jgi:CheY-like chemotaxis protein
MSHELRTPLNAILGFGQVLEAEELTPLQEESVGHILKGGDHLLGLINEVLDLSRMDAGKINLSMEPVPLWDVIKESLDLVRPLATQRDVTLYDDANNGCFGYVMADRQRLKQVIINLLSNAVKYNVRGGRVAVSCQQLQNGRLRFGVEDTGPGISRENIEKVFIPFERLSYDSSDVEGTGLGLPLSRRLAEAMGGTLAVQSLPEQGSIFYVELPCADSPVEQLNRELANQASLPGFIIHEKSYTVLLVEDNVSNIRLIETIFQSRPYVELVSTMYGLPAQQLALQHKPDLVLLDLHLPDITGEEVLVALKDDPQTKEIPVVVCSADATADQIKEVLAGGAVDYLTKPLNVRQFLAVVDDVLDKPES